VTNSHHLANQCVHKELFYLAESLQYYWPADFAVVNCVPQGYLNEIAENNIPLHLARSFAEKGFQLWAEVPLKEENRRLDFFAYNYPEGITVALEFKKSIDTPQGNYEDLKQLVDIQKTACVMRNTNSITRVSSSPSTKCTELSPCCRRRSLRTDGCIR